MGTEAQSRSRPRSCMSRCLSELSEIPSGLGGSCPPEFFSSSDAKLCVEGRNIDICPDSKLEKIFVESSFHTEFQESYGDHTVSYMFGACDQRDLVSSAQCPGYDEPKCLTIGKTSTTVFNECEKNVLEKEGA